MSRDFRELLFNIAEDLNGEDLKNMKFLCANEIPRGRLDAIDTSLELFDALVQHGLLSEHDSSYLDELLASLKHCEDLRNQLKTFHGKETQK